MATEVSLRFSRSTRRLWPILPEQTSRRRGAVTEESGMTLRKRGAAKSASCDDASAAAACSSA